MFSSFLPVFNPSIIIKNIIVVEAIFTPVVNDLGLYLWECPDYNGDGEYYIGTEVASENVKAGDGTIALYPLKMVEKQQIIKNKLKEQNIPVEDNDILIFCIGYMY